MNVRRLLARNALVREAGYAALRLRGALLRSSGSEPVLVNSIPKAGTHLALSALAAMGVRNSGVLITNRDVLTEGAGIDTRFRIGERTERRLGRVGGGQYVVAHLWARAELIDLFRGLGLRLVFVIRDPRAIVVSRAHYISGLPRGIHHAKFQALRDDRERIATCIEGYPADELGPGMEPLGRLLDGYLPWADVDGCLTIRFEDLVGESGGGTDEAQIDAIGKLSNHLGTDLSRGRIEEIAAGTYSRAVPTFRKGQAESWREELDPELLDKLYVQVPPTRLEALGYPPG